MGNTKAVWSVFVGLVALAVLVAGAVAARELEEVGLREAGGAVPLGFVLALVSLSLARRASFDYQRTLGRIGGRATATVGRFVGTVALLVALSAALALGVFAVLTVVLD